MMSYHSFIMSLIIICEYFDLLAHTHTDFVTRWASDRVESTAWFWSSWTGWTRCLPYCSSSGAVASSQRLPRFDATEVRARPDARDWSLPFGSEWRFELHRKTDPDSWSPWPSSPEQGHSIGSSFVAEPHSGRVNLRWDPGSLSVCRGPRYIFEDRGDRDKITVGYVAKGFELRDVLPSTFRLRHDCPWPLALSEWIGPATVTPTHVLIFVHI